MIRILAGMRLISFLAALFAPLLLWAQATYYVSPNGDDGADGLSPDRAFRTLGKAATVAGPGDTVILLPGIYREVLFPRQSGLPGAPITFRARQLGEAIITSFDLASGWQLYQGRIYRCRLPQAYAGWEPRQVLEDDEFLERRSGPGSITAPGQWAYQNGYLYVRTRDDRHPADKRIEYDNRESVVSDGGYRHHIVIENLVLRGGNGPNTYDNNRGTVLIWRSSYWTFRNLIIEKSHSDGFVWAYEGQQGLVMENVWIRDVGLRGVLLQADESRRHVGITLRRVTVTRTRDVGILIRNAEDVLLEEVQVSYAGAGGINLVRTRRARIVRAIAHHNALLRDDESGFSTFEGVEDVTYTDCVSFSNGIGRDPAISTRYGAWGFFADRMSRRIQYVRCIAFDNLSAGFQALDAEEVTYLHCTSWGNNTRLPALMEEFASGWFLNDIPGDGAPTRVRLTNCMGVSLSQTPALKVYGEARQGLEADYNLWWRTDDGAPVRWHDTELGWEAYRQVSGQDAHSRYADPLLRPLLEGRQSLCEWQSAFEPPPNSPAIDAGTYVGLTFYGTAPDLGAVEVIGLPAPAQIVLQASALSDTSALVRWRIPPDSRYRYLVLERAFDGEPFSALFRTDFRPEGEYRDRIRQKGRTYYRIRIEIVPGQSLYSDVQELVPLVPASSPDPSAAPDFAFVLFPNPTRDVLTLRFGLSRADQVRLILYDTLGRQIAVLGDDHYEAGTHQLRYRFPPVAPGLYVVRLQTRSGQVAERKVLYLR